MFDSLPSDIDLLFSYFKTITLTIFQTLKIITGSSYVCTFTTKIAFNSLTTKKQKIKFSSANFQKCYLRPSYIILRIQKLEDKQ